MRKSFLLASATLFALSLSASAQQRGNTGRQNAGGASLPLPEGVKRVVSIDAYNVLLAEVERDGKRDFAPLSVRHIYSGGIARLFGGTSVPTEQFVSPGALGGNGGTGGRNGGFGGGAGGFGGNMGGNTGFGGGGNTGGFGGGGFGGGATGGGFGGGVTGGGGFGGGFGGAFQMRPVPGRGN